MTEVGGIAADQLRSYIERVERLEEEKANLQADIKEVYGEAKSLGYDPKIMRQIVRLRKMEDHERTEQAEIMEVYCRALGMDGANPFNPLSELDRARHKGTVKPPEATPLEQAVDQAISRNDDDEYYEACAHVITEQKASISFVQRKMSIGYNKAARHVERMEEAGYISASDDKGKRDVLVTVDQLVDNAKKTGAKLLALVKDHRKGAATDELADLKQRNDAAIKKADDLRAQANRAAENRAQMKRRGGKPHPASMPGAVG